MDKNFNPDKQHTLSKSVSISGTGLHTGINVDMTLKPANPGFGFQFQRIDMPGMPVIKADCDLVTDTSRGTTLEKGDAKVSTVEHILAALVGMGVDNCLIEINGPEIPIIDGSSEPFVEIIEQTGVLEQDAAKGPADSRRHRVRRNERVRFQDAQEGRDHSLRPQREISPAGSRDRGPRRAKRWRHHRDEHGRSRHRHQTRCRRPGRGRIARHRHRTSRVAPD